jgi:hypothetical protein
MGDKHKTAILESDVLAYGSIRSFNFILKYIFKVSKIWAKKINEYILKFYVFTKSFHRKSFLYVFLHKSQIMLGFGELGMRI